MWSVKTTPVTPKIVEVEKIVEVKKYVDVNYADIDERRFSQELRRRWHEDHGADVHTGASAIEWFTRMMKDGIIAMLVEECVFIPKEYTSMADSVRKAQDHETR